MKKLHLFSYISLFFGYIAVGVIAFWLFWPYKVFELKSPITVDKKNYNAGDTLTYTVDYCKYKSLPATLYRSYVDGVIYNIASIVANNPTGCHVTHPTTLVPNLPSGVYFIRLVFVYQVNPLRTITKTIETEPFNIIFNDSTASGHLQDEQ